MNKQTIYAADWESYYDKSCSIKTLSPRGYFSHPDFDAYMVTVVGSDGYEYVGHPKDFDYSLFDDNIVLSHNASFDESLYLFGVEKGWYKPCTPAAWHCTADMVAFLGLPRSLKDASKAALGIELSKTTRDNMCGKRWETMSEEFKAEVSRYALDDARYCLALWEKLSPQWPEFERKISATNRKIGQRGLPIDEPLLRRNLEIIKQALFVAESTIPWVKDGEYTPLSRKAFNAECRKNNVEPPVSLAQDSPEADFWFAKYEREFSWARGVQNFRRLNSFQKKLEAFDAGLMADGRYYGGFMYCGANPTARFSGSGGNLNLQNLTREETFGVNFRNMIVAGEGKKLIIADLAQIEVRTLFWWAKDFEALDLIRNSDDIYHVIGVMLNLHDPAEGPLRNKKDLRQRIKAMALGCQFGLGAKGFSAYSGMPLAEAEESVRIYREKMKSIVKFWETLKTDIAMSSALGQELVIEMPSGRSMRYGVPRKMKATYPDGGTRFEYVGKMVRNGQRRDYRLWMGGLAENCIGLQTEVLTDTKGWVAIKDVQLSDKVWDGVEFVAHSGFKPSGTQEVINVHGVWATPDHKFLVGEEWLPAEKVCTTPMDMILSSDYECKQRLHRDEVRNMHCAPQEGKHQEHEWDKAQDPSPLGTPMRLREDPNPINNPDEEGQNVRVLMSDIPRKSLQEVPHSPAVQPQTLPSLARDEGAVQLPKAQYVAQLRGSGDTSLREVAELSELLEGHAANLERRADAGPDQQRRGLLPRELSLGNEVRARQKHTEDQAFGRAVSDLGGPRGEHKDPILKATEGLADGGSPNSEGTVRELLGGEIQEEWEHPKVKAPTGHASSSGAERVEDVYRIPPPEAWVASASGSNNTSKTTKPVGDLLNCGPRNRFIVRASEEGPYLTCHNCAQGLARDVFADMMLRVEAAKYEVILHCHDELVVLAEEDKAEEALAEILQIMSEPPAWIPDLPVAAEGHIASCYSK